MKKIFVILLHFIFICALNAQPMLTRVDTLKLIQASILGGISFNGESISITTTSQVGNYPQLFLRKLDRDLKLVMPIKQLTFSTDSASRKKITDHKHLYMSGFHYVTFSTESDHDLGPAST